MKLEFPKCSFNRVCKVLLTEAEIITSYHPSSLSVSSNAHLNLTPHSVCLCSGIRLTLRGKSHTEWKINKAGERRTVKEDEYYIDDKKVLWGKG